MLDQWCEELARAARAHDAVAFQASTQLVWQAAQGATPGELNWALQKVCHLFDTVDGLPMALAGRLAVLGGALVEEGADPAPLVGVAVAGVGASADACVEFAAAWQRIVGTDRPLPPPVDNQAAFDAAVAALTGHTGTGGYSDDSACHKPTRMRWRPTGSPRLCGRSRPPRCCISPRYAATYRCAIR